MDKVDVKKDNMFKAIIISLLFPVFYVVLQLVVNLVYQLLYGIIYFAERQADYANFVENARAAVAANSMYILLSAMVIFAIIVFLIFRIRKENLLKRIQWNSVSIPIYGLVAIAAIVNIFTINLLTYVVLPQSWLEGAEGYSDSAASGGILLTLVIVVLLGPVVEEVIYRGLMMTSLQKSVPVWFAVAFTAIVFSAIHYSGGIGQLIGTAWNGVFFCLLFLWTKSIRTSILAHIINNLIAWLLPVNVIINMSLPGKFILFVVGMTFTVFVLHMIYKRMNNGIVDVTE